MCSRWPFAGTKNASHPVARQIPSTEERSAYGCWQTPDELFAFCDKLAGPEGEVVTRELITAQFTSSFPREDIDWIDGEILAMPRAYAAALILDHAQRDWRDVFPRIDR